MRILWIDEIPEEWKWLLNPTGLARYWLFIEELYQVHIISVETSKWVIDILDAVRWENFPYKDIKIWKPTISHFRRINRTRHMWVLIENNKWVIQLLEWTLDNALMPTKWRDTDFPNITI
jgi:hypothetical protein